MPHKMPKNLPDGVRSTCVSSVTAAGGMGPYWRAAQAGELVCSAVQREAAPLAASRAGAHQVRE